MAGGRLWIAVIVVAVATVPLLGLIATQQQLSGDKDNPCGTALRIDLRAPTLLRDRVAHVYDDAGQGAFSEDEADRRADDLLDEAARIEDRCKDRQRLALLGLGAGGTAAAAAVALSTYQLGRRSGRREGRGPSEE